jgi:N6-adenosine-specific RNA methylase IME4
MKKTYPIHPAAALLPLMTGEERAELKESLRQGGQLVPIQLHKHKGKECVLDGRNRQELLLELGMTPKYITADLRGRTPERFVVDMNLERRMLTPSQKGALALKLMPEMKKAAKVRQAVAGKTGRAPAGAASAAKKAAKAVGASTRTVERAIAIEKKAPHLLPLIELGTVTLKQAEKQIRHGEQVKVVEKYVPPDDKFNVITVDFSWPYDDALEGDTMRGAPPYPPQSIDEIVKFIRGPLARCCDDVCVLGNWITGPMALDLHVGPVVQREIEMLGFKPLHERIWKKTRATGGQFVGLGRPIRWDAEKLQIYVRGKVVFNDLGEEHGRPIQQTVFEAHVGEHSEKPQRAYTDLEQLVPYTKRLEMFSRAPREGWVTTGAEMPEAATAPVGAATTSGTAQVDGALVPPPPVVSASPDKGGALSERSDKPRGKRKLKIDDIDDLSSVKGEGIAAVSPLGPEFVATAHGEAGPAPTPQPPVVEGTASLQNGWKAVAEAEAAPTPPVTDPWEYPRAEGSRPIGFKVGTDHVELSGDLKRGEVAHLPAEAAPPAELAVERDADAPPPVDPLSVKPVDDDQIPF